MLTIYLEESAMTIQRREQNKIFHSSAFLHHFVLELEGTVGSYCLKKSSWHITLPGHKLIKATSYCNRRLDTFAMTLQIYIFHACWLHPWIWCIELFLSFEWIAPSAIFQCLPKSQSMFRWKANSNFAKPVLKWVPNFNFFTAPVINETPQFCPAFLLFLQNLKKQRSWPGCFGTKHSIFSEWKMRDC